MERGQQVILNMIVTKDIDNKAFEYIDPWSEALAYIELEIRASYHSTIMDTPGRAVFGRYMQFNLASFVDWIVVTAAKQQQVDIDNFQENARRVTHSYTIGNTCYVEMTGIYHKLDYNKKEPYRTTE